ncbi:MAG: type I DNA topoisomerase [Candidatus Stahlbacteria bacterium]|nr:type I DNA topoisomerase [Candidatus Stahlbacteria bacterium]
MKLIIVESPTKAKTIQGFLTKSYEVISSMGHIIDLPPKKFGVDVDNDFAPQYVILKKDIANKLKDSADKAELVILATDPDREGEAIAYHIKSLIKSPAKRALFYEITKDAVIKSLDNLNSINMDKVEAQQARRILDRIVGYDTSPFLWSIFHKPSLSAGRVQSVALRLICEREQEIKNFKPEEYWEIKCNLNGKNEFTANLIKIEPPNGKLIKIEIPNAKEATQIEKELKAQDFIVKSFSKKDKQKSPSPPYITSTLQQDASSKLKFSTKQTMMMAQQLFEGIEIGEKGRVGLITYMRTDSFRIAPHAINEARDYILKELGKEYLPAKPRSYGKVAGAHEAIRPTSVYRTPEAVKQYLSGQQFRIYSLIWNRFVASQIQNAIYEHRKLTISAGKYELTAESENLKFAGFTKIYAPEIKKEETLPELVKGTKLNLREVLKEQKFTQPKPRYTEGTMVKELESNGIGRPSTYANIISRIIEKSYVNKIEGKLTPTELGEAVNKVLTSQFPDIFNVNFTREMEENLDKIEAKTTDRLTVLNSFYKPFKEDVIRFSQTKKEVRTEITEITNEKCELCGKPLVIKWGKHGKFLACSGFPECKNAKPINKSEEQTEITNEKCEHCGKQMVIKSGKYGKFLACSGFPECKNTKPINKPKVVVAKCPECGSDIIERHTKRRRLFYGCSNYPKCKFALWYKPVDKKCPSCGYPIMVERKKRTFTAYDL